jgi:ElaB/YqjD/DUF883 family membrane-anchored ribosome-binding protein
MVQKVPDESSASSEHALIQEIAEPLANLPDDPALEVADVEFQIVLRGYDRLAVDAYVRRTSRLVAELNAGRSPQAAVRRALERVGEEVSGILQRAHDTAEEITSRSRAEADDRLEAAQSEAEALLADARTNVEDTVGGAQHRLTELDAETDRIWAERQRIVEDARNLAAQLLALAEAAREQHLVEHGAEAEADTGEHELAEDDEDEYEDEHDEDEHDEDEHDEDEHDEDEHDEDEHDEDEHDEDEDDEGDTGELTEPFDIEAEAPLPGEEATQVHPVRRGKRPPPEDDDDELLAHDAE